MEKFQVMRELEKYELIDLNGGTINLSSWLRGSAWMIAAGYIMDHWTDLKAGMIDGYRDGIRDNK